MNKFEISLLSILLCMECVASVSVVAQITVGVKAGDWIEYN